MIIARCGSRRHSVWVKCDVKRIFEPISWLENIFDVTLIINYHSNQLSIELISFFNFITWETISQKVQMLIAWQMCSIHIREITMHPSFNHRKRQNIYARKADWSEKNWLFSLASRNRLLLEQESTKTMPKRTNMSSPELFKERSKFVTRPQVVEYILLSSISEKWDMMLV